MKKELLALAAACAVAFASWPVAAANFYTAGDSHCLEIARVLGKKWKTVAEDGATTKDLPSQLADIPFESFVIVCIGTNDSASRRLMNLTAFYTKTALDVAKWRSLKLVWIGPSTIRRDGWYQRADMIDFQFEALIGERGIPYISIFGDPGHRPGADNVHLSRSSYRALGAVGAMHLYH